MVQVSPIPPERVAEGSISLDWVDIDNHGDLFFIEGRPQEKGRQILLKLDQKGQVSEVTPSPINVKSRVHEYGGKAFCLLQNGVAYINDMDQSLYVNGRRLTDGTLRFADMLEVNGGIIAVAEAHLEGRVNNFLAFIDLEEGKVTPLFTSSDFVAAPSLSPDGKRLAFLTWNHPEMPWQGTTLWVGTLDGNRLIEPKALYGGKKESIFQPGWSSDGKLLYMSDKTGFWNLYEEEVPLFPFPADCGRPLWVLGMRTWAVDGEDLVLSFLHEGSWRLAHRRKGEWIFLPYEAAEMSSLRLKNGKLFFAANFKDDMRKIVTYDLTTWTEEKLYGKPLDLETFSLPEPISFFSGGRKISAFYYPPQDSNLKKPPLIVKAHGGPTALATPSFNWTVAYWNSLGYGYLDVNYTGSSGFGRAFREALNGYWGTYDWQDCEKGALHLVEEGRVDSKALFITGGSSGGYTVLAALTLGTVFKGGTSYYGVTDLQLLSAETHKFEAHYLDSLIGPHLENLPFEKLEKPLLFLHGKEDKVVPPDQPKVLHELLKKKGIATDLILYEGEGHGFRKKETLIDVLKQEHAFYKRIT